MEDTGAAIGYSTDAELDAALELIALDAGRRGELRRQARAAHAARFSVDGHLERYLSLIATLARERGDRERPRQPRRP